MPQPDQPGNDTELAELKDFFKSCIKGIGAGLIIGVTWPFVLAFLLLNPHITAAAKMR